MPVGNTADARPFHKSRHATSQRVSARIALIYIISVRIVPCIPSSLSRNGAMTRGGKGKAEEGPSSAARLCISSEGGVWGAVERAGKRLSDRMILDDGEEES